ncbi:hypothetical protein JXJ21_16290 [candidate division KSB1 bacterium]|nr:hypothetical protein [candidate division KSB1 bacterium]
MLKTINSFKPAILAAIVILFWFSTGASESPNYPPEPDSHIIQDVFSDSMLRQYTVSASDILDSEKRYQSGAALITICDSLWLCIEPAEIPADEFTRDDSLRFEKLMREGMRHIGGNLEIDPKLREISPRAYKLRSEDITFVLFELQKQAIKEFFQAKRINPYNIDVEVLAFQETYQKLKKYSHRDNWISYAPEFLHLIEKCNWLPYEARDIYILKGDIYSDLKQWQKAFENYEQAYQMVAGTIYPIGVDSVYAEKMDSIASRAFIAEERQKMANVRIEESMEFISLSDSLYDFYKYVSDSIEALSISYYDSLFAKKLMEKALERISPGQTLGRKQFNNIRKRKLELHKEDIHAVSKELLLIAETGFLDAKQLDPFDLRIRLNLMNSLYARIAERYNDLAYHQKAADEMEHLLWAKKDRAMYYYHLGISYKKLGKWEDAYRNFKQAENVLRKTSLLSGQIENREAYFDAPDTAPVDTLQLYKFIMFQAEAQRRMYDGKISLALYRYAFNLAPNAEQRRIVQNEIDWINWDDGNIRASEVLDSAKAYYDEQNFNDAKRVYLKLLDMLWTGRTTNEVNWRIAMIDFNDLENFAEGLVRMRKVIDSISLDSTSLADNILYPRYLRNYGEMCYNSAMRYVRDEDKLHAYVYLSQAAAIEWYGRPKSNLELAKLSSFDPDEAIRLCELALNERHYLGPDDVRQIAKLMSESYRKQANFRLAREWHTKSQDKRWLASQNMVTSK